MQWTRTVCDMLSIYTCGDYVISQNYEDGWQLSWYGRALNRLEAIPSLKKAKEYAEEHARFN